jgi:hypothetical protein
MKVVQIYKDGTMDEVECKLTEKNICKCLTDKSNSCGEGKIKLLYKWAYDNHNLLCYGWYEGEVGFENKHDLVPSGCSDFIDTDSSEKLLFGDIFIVKQCSKKKYVSFEVSDYGGFYNFGFGGFEDCESEEDGGNTEEEDGDYEPANGSSEEEELPIYELEENLEEDTTEY